MKLATKIILFCSCTFILILFIFSLCKHQKSLFKHETINLKNNYELHIYYDSSDKFITDICLFNSKVLAFSILFSTKNNRIKIKAITRNFHDKTITEIYDEKGNILSVKILPKKTSTIITYFYDKTWNKIKEEKYLIRRNIPRELLKKLLKSDEINSRD